MLMDISESLSLLTDMFKSKDWFNDVGADELGRLVVYCNYMNAEVFSATPSKLGDRYVLIQFASAKKVEVKPAIAPIIEAPPIVERPTDLNVPYLIRELDRLEKICGSNSLQDVFYEIHDGKNAVTNVSSRYPEVREGLEWLYQSYGFDVIYDEMDG